MTSRQSVTLQFMACLPQKNHYFLGLPQFVFDLLKIPSITYFVKPIEMKKHADEMANMVKKKLIVKSNGIFLQFVLTHLSCPMFLAKKKKRAIYGSIPNQEYFSSTLYIKKHERVHSGFKVSKSKASSATFLCYDLK